MTRGSGAHLPLTLLSRVLTRRLSHVEDLSATSAFRLEQLSEELRDLLKAHAFDEANAQRLMNLPERHRPRDAQNASKWICNGLARQKLQDDLEYARRHEDRCGEGALEVVQSLAAAQKGLTVERVGTSVARFYRAAVMNDK